MKISVAANMFERTSAPRWLCNKARRLLHTRLRSLEHGTIVLHEGDRRWSFGHEDEVCPFSVHVSVHDPAMYVQLMFNGDIGAGESYMKGLWSCAQLVELMRIFVINREALLGLGQGLAKLSAPLLKLYAWTRRNSRRNSRRNIEAHYDIGNDFYRLFLDPRMMYSAAVYPSANSTLDEASSHKLDIICQKLQLSPHDHLLEIGTGWGGLAMHAAKNYGCQVTTTTVSTEQFEYARARIVEAGLCDRIRLLKQDYRDLQGQFDKLVSVEMIEAVGYQYYDVFFNTCNRLLKPQGLALLQAITINDQYYENATRSVDFIQRYIFPGGGLPAVHVVMNHIAKNTDMRLLHAFDFAQDYAKTLHDWRKRFVDKLDCVKAMGYSDTFIKMWEYYLCYCEAGFLERSIGVSQFLFAKPLNRCAAVLP